MYINQKLGIRWQTTNSSYFNVTNGVKQGGVISPILFCMYMDGLLKLPSLFTKEYLLHDFSEILK